MGWLTQHRPFVRIFAVQNHIFLKVETAATIYATGIGGRERNEDAVRLENGAMVVCDGVGGAPDGDFASASTADVLISALSAMRAMPDKAELDALMHRMREHVAHTLAQRPDRVGMATTAVFSLVREERLWVGWCGDSRAYLIRDGRVVFKTADHNVAAALVESGLLTEEQARQDPRRNALLRAVVYTPAPVVLPFDFHKAALIPGDVLVLATDGAYSHFSDAQWAKIWSENSLVDAAEIVKSRASDVHDDNYTFCAFKQ
mgnify:CR=1 FL=1